MKPNLRHSCRSSILGLAVAALALLLPGSAAAQSTSALTVDLVVGQVEIGSGEPPLWRAAEVGQALRPGDKIRTGDRGRVELTGPRGVVRLFDDSLLELPPAAQATDADRVRMKRGSSVFDVLKAKQRSFEVESPTAVVMVKGTRFGVNVLPDGSQVSVSRGLVGVRALGAAAREVLVHPGFTATGGPAHSFALSLTPPGADPWQRWSDGEKPALPERVAAVSPARVALRQANDRALERSAALRAATVRSGEAPIPAAAAPAKASGVAKGRVATASPPDPVDRLKNRANAQRRKQLMAAHALASLKGGTGAANGSGNGASAAGGLEISLVGNDQVKVMAPGVGAQVMTEDFIEDVVDGTSSFNSALADLLSSYGISQQAFALQLETLLD